MATGCRYTSAAKLMALAFLVGCAGLLQSARFTTHGVPPTVLEGNTRFAILPFTGAPQEADFLSQLDASIYCAFQERERFKVVGPEAGRRAMAQDKFFPSQFRYPEIPQRLADRPEVDCLFYGQVEGLRLVFQQGKEIRREIVGTQRVREKTKDKNNQTIFVERDLPVYADRVYYLLQGRLTGTCRMVLLQARKGKVLWQSELSLDKIIQKEARQAELLPPRRSVAKELAGQTVAQTVAEVEGSLLPNPKTLNRRLAFAAHSSGVYANRLHAANRLALEGNWE
jgi:hypothetical protein